MKHNQQKKHEFKLCIVSGMHDAKVIKDRVHTKNGVRKRDYQVACYCIINNKYAKIYIIQSKLGYSQKANES